MNTKFSEFIRNASPEEKKRVFMKVMDDVSKAQQAVIDKAHRLDVKDQQCGCYYCCEIFNGNTITEFVDGSKTAICPLCGVDSVIIKVTDKNELKELNTKWFGST
ncbi:hypothetical protein NX722_02900 [Endozoicomonas gorgoniicola]|uniref:DPH-type MB domain-containing protein n=1 Tax=Endozoicomonas gorgoniicola TaxID=1234144 RepID=A0ABT3MR73_9GAMM|nr:hypothetical protein [Endozoicomonas gorgoniicola]MCW7551608.1 hypothetical protein [Endozoicomonas gorgoniicola]